MKADLLRQLSDYGAHHEETQAAVDFEEIERRAVRSLAPPVQRESLDRRPTALMRGAAVFITAAAVMVLAVGAVVLVQENGPTVATQPPIAPSTAPSLTLEQPAHVTTEAPVPTEAPATTSPTRPPPASAGFNGVTWTTTGAVPAERMGEGFPAPGYTFGSDLQRAYAEAPCCFEIYKTPAGYLGLGQPDAAGRAFNPPDLEPQLGVVGQWYAPYSKPWGYPTEVWFSTDGVDWELMASDAFGSGTAVLASDPFVVAERGGTWMVIGASDAGGPEDLDVVGNGPSGTEGSDLPRDAIPTMWMSSDLVTWTQKTEPWDSEGSRTRLTSVATSERGWVVFGVRVSEVAPFAAEWVGWSSEDGVVWQPLPIGAQLGEVSPCSGERPWRCSWLQGAITADAVVVYAWTWDLPVTDWRQATWRLLIGDLPTESGGSGFPGA